MKYKTTRPTWCDGRIYKAGEVIEPRAKSERVVREVFKAEPLAEPRPVRKAATPRPVEPSAPEPVTSLATLETPKPAPAPKGRYLNRRLKSDD